MLLDTHALLWFGLGQGLIPSAQEAIARALDEGRIYVSAISAWEIGNLVRTRGLLLLPDAATWFADATSDPKMRVLALDSGTVFASANLPGDFHRDPADRFLVATARSLAVPILTRDSRILAYAEAGHVHAVPC